MGTDRRPGYIWRDWTFITFVIIVFLLYAMICCAGFAFDVDWSR